MAGPTDVAPLDRDQRPTLKTLAFMTGLAVTTVSRALKDGPEIGEETRRRVQLLASQIGYRPNRAGVRLRTGKTNVISLILNTHEEVMGMVSAMIYGVSEAIAATPYHLVVTPYSVTNDALAPVRYVVETGSADGIIISRTEPNDPRVRYLQARNFPFVTHGRTQLAMPHPYYDFDNAAFAELAVQRLASRGRSRIALLAPTPGLTFYQHMTSGFVEAVERRGLSEVAFRNVNLDSPLEEIHRRAAELAASPHCPDGIVCGGGVASIALVSGLEQAGRRLGHDIDVVTKQTSQLLQWYRPEMIIVNEDIRHAGRELARALMRAIDGAAPKDLQMLVGPSDFSQLR